MIPQIFMTQRISVGFVIVIWFGMKKKVLRTKCLSHCDKMTESLKRKWYLLGIGKWKPLDHVSTAVSCSVGVGMGLGEAVMWDTGLLSMVLWSECLCILSSVVTGLWLTISKSSLKQLAVGSGSTYKWPQDSGVSTCGGESWCYSHDHLAGFSGWLNEPCYISMKGPVLQIWDPKAKFFSSHLCFFCFVYSLKIYFF